MVGRASSPCVLRIGDGHVVEGGGSDGGSAAAVDRQADVHRCVHGDALAGAQLRPGHTVGRDVAAEAVAAAADSDPVGRGDGGVTGFRGAAAGNGAHIKVDTGVGRPLGGFDVGRSGIEGVADHDSGGDVAGATLQVEQAGGEGAVASQGLVDEVEGVGGAVDLGACADDGEGAVVVVGFSGQADGAEVLIEPGSGQGGGSGIDGDVVEGGGSESGSAAAGDGQADIDGGIHGDGLHGAELRPVDAVGRGIAEEGAAAAGDHDPVGQRERAVGRFGGGAARGGTDIEEDAVVVGPVRGFGVGGGGIEGVADHDSGGGVAGATGEADQAGDDGAVAVQRLIDEVEGVGGAVDLRTGTFDGEDTVGIAGATGHTRRANIPIHPRRRRRGGYHRQRNRCVVIQSPGRARNRDGAIAYDR